MSHRLEPRDLRRLAVVRERPASPAAVLDDTDSVVGRFEQTFRCEFAIIRWAKPEDVIELGGVPLDDELAVDETGGSPEAEPPLGVPPDP